MKVHVRPKQTVARDAGARLGDLLRIHERATILCSGGSALSILDFVPQAILTSTLSISVLDERANEPSASNIAALAGTGFAKRLVAVGGIMFDSTQLRGNVADVANHLAEFVLRRREAGDSLIVVFGIGTDGHTAGIAPMPDDINRFERLFQSEPAGYVGYDAGKRLPHPFRATANLELIESIDAGIAFATGDEKREAIQAVLFGAPYNRVPAAVLRMLPTVELFTDIVGLPVVE